MKSFLVTAIVFVSAYSSAHEVEDVHVEGRKVNLVGQAVSASEGLVGQREIEIRPILRSGDILELVPGMVVTQHSGSGKANQYFLRGFNLDHGTDFATFVEGMPVNMRTHGHGQGYTDLNFIIPETVQELAYKKGAYYADVGDFSGAGGAAFSLAQRFDKNSLALGLGKDNYVRALLLADAQLQSGDMLFALEANAYDGPWTDIDENIEKLNLLARYSLPVAQGEWAITFMAYDNSWNSADQIPMRAVDRGLIDELGSIDDTVGGQSSRYSLSTRWQNEHWQANAYAIAYSMKLWSNFTYFLDNEALGDQFEQVDERGIYGGDVRYLAEGTLANKPMENTLGLEVRYDQIDEVGLYATRERRRRGLVRSDEVQQFSTGLFWQNEITWSHHVRSVIGARYDYFNFDVDSGEQLNINGVDLSANSGSASEGLPSLKGSLVFTHNANWESYLALGQSFHSNDARGTTTVVDPADGAAVEPVDALVRSLGYEAGARGFISDKLNTSLSIWVLELDSELLFVGDAGNTEVSRPSQRKGLELTAYYALDDYWSLDLEYAYTDAEFTDYAEEGSAVPGALEHVLQAGISLQLEDGWFGSLRLRHFGERPLLEDSSIMADAATLWNLRAGYNWNNFAFYADVLNLGDSSDHDIDYYYTSRLSGEPPEDDIHYHVVEPRTARLTLSYLY